MNLEAAAWVCCCHLQFFNNELSADTSVAKKSRSIARQYDSLPAYISQMEVQSVAAFLAQQFNGVVPDWVSCCLGMPTSRCSCWHDWCVVLVNERERIATPLQHSLL